jgi:hypothetical protein
VIAADHPFLDIVFTMVICCAWVLVVEQLRGLRAAHAERPQPPLGHDIVIRAAFRAQ